jgi:hypothetical protein
MFVAVFSSIGPRIVKFLLVLTDSDSTNHRERQRQDRQFHRVHTPRLRQTKPTTSRYGSVSGGTLLRLTLRLKSGYTPPIIAEDTMINRVVDYVVVPVGILVAPFFLGGSAFLVGLGVYRIFMPGPPGPDHEPGLSACWAIISPAWPLFLITALSTVIAMPALKLGYQLFADTLRTHWKKIIAVALLTSAIVILWKWLSPASFGHLLNYILGNQEELIRRRG